MLFMAFQAADPQSARAYTTLTNLHLSIRPRHSLLPVVRGPDGSKILIRNSVYSVSLWQIRFLWVLCLISVPSS
jgi:hypothetical protein